MTVTDDGHRLPRVKRAQVVRSESLAEKNFVTKWMSLTSFKYSENYEKKIFRKTERLQTMNIKLQSHSKFNETCIHAIYIYICNMIIRLNDQRIW